MTLDYSSKDYRLFIWDTPSDSESGYTSWYSNTSYSIESPTQKHRALRPPNIFRPFTGSTKNSTPPRVPLPLESAVRVSDTNHARLAHRERLGSIRSPAQVIQTLFVFFVGAELLTARGGSDSETKDQILHPWARSWDLTGPLVRCLRKRDKGSGREHLGKFTEFPLINYIFAFY